MSLAPANLDGAPIKFFLVDRNKQGRWDVVLELVGCRPVQAEIRDCRPETIKLVYELCYQTAIKHLAKAMREIPTIEQKTQ